MKQTIQRKAYLNEAEDELIRSKCARLGLSFSRAAVDALLHWQPDRTGISRHRHRPTYGRAMGLPSRNCLRL